MNKESAGILHVVRRRAATWLDRLTDQFRVMVDFMPRLRDAIDADDLPIPFILRIGRERVIRSGRSDRATPSPSFKAKHRLVAPRAERRPAARSTLRTSQSHLVAQTAGSGRSRRSGLGDSAH
jgi:hypothetical protein